jgi:hypothetical protein
MKQTFSTQTTAGPIPHMVLFAQINGKTEVVRAPVCLRINRSKEGLLDRFHPPEVDGECFVYALPGGKTFRALP